MRSLNKNLNFIFIILLLFSIFSCARDRYDNEVLYDSVGFEQGSNPNKLKVAPDYFYRQAKTMMPPSQQYQGQPMQPAPAPQQYSSPQPYYPNTYASPPYQVYPNPGSRFYSNPYAIPPSPYYPQQYDTDQYYVPPTYSYGMEQSGSSRQSTIQK